MCFCLFVLASLAQPLFFIVPPSLDSSISLVCFCFSDLTFLGQLYFCWCPRFSESIPIPCVLLLFCPGFSRALAAAASRLRWELLFCWGPSLSRSFPTPWVVCFSVQASLRQHFVLLGSRLLFSLPTPCVFLLFFPGFSGTAFVF